MRVVHVTPYYVPEVEFGGPPASVHELCHALRRSGVDVHVVTTSASENAGSLSVDDVPITRIRRRSRVGFAAALDDVLDRELSTADVCHLHALFNWPVWRGAARARRCGRPVVVSPRGMLEPAALAYHRCRKQIAWQLFDRHVVTRASAVVASSAREADTLVGRGVRSIVVPNGITMPALLSSRGQFRAARSIPAQAQVITFLGRLHPIKRLDLLAGAFLQVAAQNPLAVLIIAGPDEANIWPELQQRLSTVRDRVHWIGAVGAEEKWQLLADSDVFALCSDSESYGRVVAEALAAGVPPVVTQTCPWQLLETEHVGRWVPQDASAIAEAIAELLADPIKRGSCSARARAYATTHFAWDRIVSRYVDLYQSVLSTSNAPALAAHAGVNLH